MSYIDVTKKECANNTAFSAQCLDSPAAISTKKIIDISNRCIKVSNNRWHYADSSLPIIGLVVGLIGIVLQAYATVNDKGKPKWLRALTLVGLCLTATLTLAIFFISMHFPPVALMLSFITVGLGLTMQSIDFLSSLTTFVLAKYRVDHPPKKDNSNQLAMLNAKHNMLIKQQITLTYQLENEKNQTNKKALNVQFQRIEKKIIKTEKKKHQLHKPLEHAKSEVAKTKAALKGSCIGMAISLSTSTLAIIGLTLAVGNPPLGLALIGLGLVFDGIVLSRKINKWKRHRAKDRQLTNHLQHRSKIAFSLSCNQLKKEQKSVKQSFSRVLVELASKQKSATNDSTFTGSYKPQPAKKNAFFETKPSQNIEQVSNLLTITTLSK